MEGYSEYSLDNQHQELMGENLLHKEQSPYLLQHADNPVHWHAWNDEAFKLAKELNKPVFLSIGYATCHWCHVMAHESFEDKSIAELMNDAFINIKVDREERPDIDNTYMTVCQMITGHGGWPLTIVMTPDKEPFFAATYIPKDSRFERIGMRQLIPAIEHHWKNEYESIRKAVDSIASGYSKQQLFNPISELPKDLIETTYRQMSLRFDPEFGGFGVEPKFPTPHNLLFLLRYGMTNYDEEAVNMVLHTLKQMRLGGIFDQVGYGFHRYSTDREWLLPHFEKMLYDQALLIMAYAEAYQLTKDPLLKQTIDETIEYVIRDLSNKDGGFYSAEDADSEGEEGKFYTWSTEELKSILTEDQYQFALNSMNLKKEGNFNDEASRKPTGLNILHFKNQDLISIDIMKDIRSKLKSVREKRIRPQLDDKILTDWNALMITALAKAGYMLGNDQYIGFAKDGIRFIENYLIDNSKLLHRYRNGEADIEAFADDYAFLIAAFIELYQSTFESEYLTKAIYWNSEFIKHFWDTTKGGFFFTKTDKDQPFGREKVVYDGAIPSSNSIAMLNLLKLAKLTGDQKFALMVDSMLKLFGGQYSSYGDQHTQALQAVQFNGPDSIEVVIAEGSKGLKTRHVVNEIRKHYLPNMVMMRRPNEGYDLVFEFSDFIKKQKPLNDETTLFLCENFVCKRPTNSLTEFRLMLTKDQTAD